MFDFGKILKRAWQVLWDYKILWVFGFVLAITAGATFPNGGISGSGWQTNAEELRNLRYYHREDFQYLWGQTPEQVINLIIVLGIALLVLILVWSIGAAILRYVSETATIRMVDEYEQSGSKVGFRQGWRYGWSRNAWRLFLIDLLVHVPVYIFLVLFGLIGVWEYFAVVGGSEGVIIFSLVTGVGLAFLLLFLTVLIMAVMYVIRHFAWRVCALEGTGVLDSFRRGYALVRRNWQNVGLMWLIMLGLGIAWGIVMILLAIPLLIICVFTIILGVVLAILPVLLSSGIASLFVPFPWYWFIGGLMGLPLFFIGTFAPIYFVSGWAEVFKSSIWTLAYRELKVLEATALSETPEAAA